MTARRRRRSGLGTSDCREESVNIIGGGIIIIARLTIDMRHGGAGPESGAAPYKKPKCN